MAVFHELDIFQKDVREFLNLKLNLESDVRDDTKTHVELEFRLGVFEFPPNKSFVFQPHFSSKSQTRYVENWYQYLLTWTTIYPHIISRVSRINYYKSYLNLQDAKSNRVLNVHGIHKSDNQAPHYLCKQSHGVKTYTITNRPMDMRMALNVEKVLEGKELKQVDETVQDFFRFCSRETFQITCPFAITLDSTTYEFKILFHVDITRVSAKLNTKEDNKEPFSYMVEVEMVSSFFEPELNMDEKLPEEKRNELRQRQIEQINQKICRVIWMMLGTGEERYDDQGNKSYISLSAPVFAHMV